MLPSQAQSIYDREINLFRDFDRFRRSELSEYLKSVFFFVSDAVCLSVGMYGQVDGGAPPYRLNGWTNFIHNRYLRVFPLKGGSR
jgi:hypothetical protein